MLYDNLALTLRPRGPIDVLFAPEGHPMGTLGDLVRELMMLTMMNLLGPMRAHGVPGESKGGFRDPDVHQ